MIAVACPMLTLFYCLSTFTFDRAKFAINLEVFPAGWFEQGARVIADPVEVAVISKALKSLRITSVMDFLSRTAVNVMLCYRLRHVVDLKEAAQQRVPEEESRWCHSSSVVGSLVGSFGRGEHADIQLGV